MSAGTLGGVIGATSIGTCNTLLLLLSDAMVFIIKSAAIINVACYLILHQADIRGALCRLTRLPAISS